MNEEYLLIEKDILPDYYDKIIRAKVMVEKENKSISEACKTVDISRSTFYKYKDLISYATKETQKRALLNFKVDDVPGVLSSILKVISKCNANILTINQNMPIHELAYINIMISMADMSQSLKTMIAKLEKVENVIKVDVLGYE